MDRTTIRKIISVAAAMGITVGLSGCEKQPATVNGVPGRLKIDENKIALEGKLESHSSYAISAGEVIKVFKTDEVYYLVNKNTNEIGIYLYYYADDDSHRLGVVYDLSTEEAIYYIAGNHYRNYDYYKYLEKNNYFVPLSTVLDSIEGVEVKDYYSLGEIQEIKDYVLNNTTIKTNIK